MKWHAHFAAVVFLTGMLIAACSVQEIGPPGPSAPPTPTAFTTGIQGAQAASAIAQARELVLTNTQLLKSLADIGLSRMTTPVPATPTSVACTDGGTYGYSGTYTAPSSYALTLTFNGCREGGYQYVGTYTLTGTPTNLTITLGSGSATFNIFNFNTSYTVLLAYLKASLSFTMTSAGTLPNTACTITSAGSINTFDYFLLDTYAMTFSALKTDYTFSTNATTLDQTTSITANGAFSESWAAQTKSLSLGFTNFTVDKVRLNATTPSYSEDDTSVSGRIAFSFNPRSFGFAGLFDVVTQTPLHYVYGPPKTTNAGTIVVNGTATAQYNAGGGVDITVTGDPTTLTYSNEYNMMKVSDYAAMEQDKPPLIAPPTIPGTPITLPTGSTMAVTLTWTGPAPTYTSTSDMDLHVKYYLATAPTTTDTETWHIDWHQDKTYPGSTGSCTDPVGIPFSDAFDLDTGHTGVCDVGLDFDDTTGYGPEHITALQLPAGYYVVSVNSFSLPLAEYGTTLYLSVHIGDNIFGPYIITPVSASDGEGTDPASWFRVADVRVNAGGTIDVFVPDATLDPWGH
jgi:uncharacterized protein YfaP (DUF2135 family)